MQLINKEDIPYTMLYKENWMKGTGEEAQGAWKSDIDKMPTVDAVQVIRCKDCKHRDGSACEYSAVWVRPNGFCHWGERKDNADND